MKANRTLALRVLNSLVSCVFALTIFALSNSSADGSGQATFVYTNNDVAVVNTISAFKVGTNGTLEEITGSPFSTGGSGSEGGFIASNRITVGVVGRFLFVANDGPPSTISVLTINPSTGSLSVVPGSPFPSGGAGDISLAVTPSSKFLYAAHEVSATISAFSVAPNGALTLVGLPTFAQGAPNGVKVSPNRRFLSVALPLNATDTGLGAVAMFSIAANGALTPVPGSPFPDGGVEGLASGVDINCASKFVFAGEANGNQTIVDVFKIAPNGALTPIPGSAFHFPSGESSSVLVLSPNDRFLFVSNQISKTVTALRVASNGSLTLVPGSPFFDTGEDFPAGMATNRAGTLIYAANFNNTVTGFLIGGSGTLTPAAGSPFPTGQPGGLLSLTVYPAKVCAAAVDDDVDDDDFDDDDERDDKDRDDDNDGKDDDADPDDDNDGEHDSVDIDDDNDRIEDVFDTETHREIQNVVVSELAAGQEHQYDMANDGSALLLIATAEATQIDPVNQPLTVRIYDPTGMLVATSPPAPGRAVATTVPVLPGIYKVKVRNGGQSTVLYEQLRIAKQAWLP